MHDRGIRFRSSFTHVLTFFQNTYTCVESGQFSGDSAASYAGADDNYVIHIRFPLYRTGMILPAVSDDRDDSFVTGIAGYL
jgi:hypothetical protein